MKHKPLSEMAPAEQVQFLVAFEAYGFGYLSATEFKALAEEITGEVVQP